MLAYEKRKQLFLLIFTSFVNTVMVIPKVFVFSAACKLKLNESKSAVADCDEVRANFIFISFFFKVFFYFFFLISKEPVMGYCFENPGQFVAFCLADSCRQILWITYEYSSVIRQKGEFQSRCYQKAKDAKFRKNEHFLPSDTFLDSPFCLMTDVLYFSF